jgi:hypothetical protein
LLIGFQSTTPPQSTKLDPQKYTTQSNRKHNRQGAEGEQGYEFLVQFLSFFREFFPFLHQSFGTSSPFSPLRLKIPKNVCGAANLWVKFSAEQRGMLFSQGICIRV